jgi:mono/diheme cytochrome c family protein
VKRLFAIGLLLGACGGGRPRGAMSDGERLYLTKCTSCHSAYQPSDYPPKAWLAAMDDMEKQKRVHLSQEERAMILQYLTGAPDGKPGAQERDVPPGPPMGKSPTPPSG